MPKTKAQKKAVAKKKAAAVKAAVAKKAEVVKKAAEKKAADEKAAAAKVAAEKATAAIAEKSKAAKADVIAQLESLNVGYDDKFALAHLQKLLAEAKAKQESPAKKPKANPAVPQAPEVTNGVGTINDHERRIFALEQKGKK